MTDSNGQARRQYHGPEIVPVGDALTWTSGDDSPVRDNVGSAALTYYDAANNPKPNKEAEEGEGDGEEEEES